MGHAEGSHHVSASLAAAVSLGSGGTGYVVAAIFPPGGWSAEEADFLRVVDPFRGGPRDRHLPAAGQGA
jgi:hypothetical protein